MRQSRTLLTFVVLGLFLAACSLAAGGSDVQPPDPQPEAPADQSQETRPTPMPAEPTEADTGNGSADNETSPTETGQEQSASLPDQGPVPTGSSALKATDPDTVNLANGDPTLVEFFAFW